MSSNLTMAKQKHLTQHDTESESNESSSHDNNSSRSTSVTTVTTGTNLSGDSTSIHNETDTHRKRLTKTKKERADNWATIEIETLHKGIDKRRSIFYGPPDQANKKAREEAWRQITQEINAVSLCNRTPSQAIKKYKNEKQRNRSKSNSHSNINPITANHSMTSLESSTHSHASSQLQYNDIAPSDSMTNIAKITPSASHDVNKSLLDLPSHVQQLQMPTDDMLLLVPEMDGLLSGMSLDALSGQGHSLHSQHTLQAINSAQSVVNGSIGNTKMTRAIPGTSMCSLVYSTGNEICGDQQTVSSNLTSYQLANNHMNVNAQNVMQLRNADHNPNQELSMHHHMQRQQQLQQQTLPNLPQQQRQQQPHHAQLRQHQQPQPVPHHLHNHHQSLMYQHHQPQFHHPTIHTQQQMHQPSMVSSQSGISLESQIKNFLLNMLLNKDGSSNASHSECNAEAEYSKQKSDMLSIIAGSLNKIEGHLSKISEVANVWIAHQIKTKPSNFGDDTTATSSDTSDSSTDNNGMSGDTNIGPQGERDPSAHLSSNID